MSSVRRRSQRILTGLRRWRDNSYWHHRLANSRRWWWLCGDCRKLRSTVTWTYPAGR